MPCPVASIVQPGTRWTTSGLLPRRVIVEAVMHGFAQVRDEGGVEFWLEPVDVVARWTRRSPALERARSKSQTQLRAVA